jgi:hypothetical protein
LWSDRAAVEKRLIKIAANVRPPAFRNDGTITAPIHPANGPIPARQILGELIGLR